MRLLGTAQFVGVAVLMGVLLLAEYLGMPFRVLSQDPAFIHDSSAAVGFLSNLGVVAWTMGAGIALFCERAARIFGLERAVQRPARGGWRPNGTHDVR